VELEPIKPVLKAPGSKRLKLNCDIPLSNFAFKFNLRRYTEVLEVWSRRRRRQAGEGAALRALHGHPGRGLHSSTFRLIISTFCGIRWVVHGVSVTKTAQVELRSGRV